MKELRTEIVINASPEKVWQVLTELDKYPEWNPFICHAFGKAETGKTVDIDFQPDSKGMKLHCTVSRYQPSRELSWKYHAYHSALFRGEHICTIEPLGEDQVRFVDREVDSMGSSSHCKPKTLTPTRDVALKRWIRRLKCVPNKTKKEEVENENIRSQSARVHPKHTFCFDLCHSGCTRFRLMGSKEPIPPLRTRTV